MHYTQEAISAIFMEKLLKNATCQDLASTIERVLEHPVKISDITRNPLAFSPSYPMDDNEDHRNLYRHVTPEGSVAHQTHLTSMLLTGQPVLWAYPYMRRNRYLCGAIYNGHWMGHVTLPDVGHFDTVDLKAVAYCAKMLALYLWTQDAPRNIDANNGHFLLWSLLNEQVQMQDIQARVIDPVFEGLTTFRLLWFDEAVSVAELLPCLEGHLRKWWHISHQGGTVVLMDGTDEHGMEELCAALSEAGISGSASDSFASLDQLLKHFEFARRALSSAQKLMGSSGLFYYNDFKLPALVKEVRNRLDVRDYEHRLLGEIEAYDIENSSDYYNTLRVYLFSKQDACRTAKALHVHKNTVFYRINKIKELFHVDFSDGLQMATLITSMLIRMRI